MSKRPKLVLIDGMAVFHRGYHALPNLTDGQGMPTGGIFGFASMTIKMLPELKPDYVIVCWDKAKTSIRSRTAYYPQYKANRVKQPDEFYAQIPFIFEYAKAMGWPLMELDDYEADDIIGALAKQAEKQGLETIIVTGDLDTLQLVDEHTKVWASRKGLTDVHMYDLAAVKERYGLTPAQFLDYKALRGDPSDNIPGVKGIGEKTALELLHKYGSLDDVYQHADEVPGALGQKLRDGKDMAIMSKKLATIMVDAPVKLDLSKEQIDRQALHKLFRDLNFKSLLAKIPGNNQGEVNTTPGLFDEASPAVTAKNRQHLAKANYICVQDAPALQSLVGNLKKQPGFAFDTETTGLDVLTADLVGMSFSFKEGEAYYIPVGHKEGKQLDLQVVIKAVKPLLEDPKIGKIGQNLKYDYQIMRRYGVEIAPISFDTMIGAFIVNPLGRGQSLDDLAYREFGIEMIPITELIGSGKNQITMVDVPIDVATTYASEDADIAWRLYEKLEPQVQQGFKRLAEQIEWPLIPILAEMELAGVELDVEFLKDFNKVISKRILALETAIHTQAGGGFNINAPAQLSQVLFGKLALSVPGVKKGKSGTLSTAAKELDKMQGMHPIIELIVEYRELVKLKNTYVDALPESVAGDGRVHTSFSQVIAQTGRLSSNNPNLQNIPIRTELGREVRKAFVAPHGRVFVSADYSQIELRVAAALSKDAAMIKAFKDGVDIHIQTASQLYEVPLDKVTKEQRYAVKAVNFGVLYGMGPHALAQSTGMSNKEASEFIGRYYDLRPKLKAYIEQVKKDARRDEYVATLFGRRRTCPEINSNNHIISAAAERMAVNVPIQGTAADIMKLAMIKLAPKLDSDNKLLLQIHDELIVECDAKDSAKVANLMKEVMENVYDLGVPLAVDTKAGKNWGELK